MDQPTAEPYACQSYHYADQAHARILSTRKIKSSNGAVQFEICNSLFLYTIGVRDERGTEAPHRTGAFSFHSVVNRCRSEGCASEQHLPGQDIKWGLSFLINPQEGPAGRSGGNLSWSGLANTYFWVDPSKQVAGVIMTQVLPFADTRVLGLNAKFESGLYKALS